MTFSVLKPLQALQQRVSTYHTGIVQAKAYRILKNYSSRILRDYDVSPLDWALLGLLHEHPQGLRFTIVAHELGVEPPMVTSMVDALSKKNLVVRSDDPTDRRAKLICLTPTGKNFIPRVEKAVRKKMKPLLRGIALRDLLTYVKVLEKIVANNAEHQDT